MYREVFVCVWWFWFWGTGAFFKVKASVMPWRLWGWPWQAEAVWLHAPELFHTYSEQKGAKWCVSDSFVGTSSTCKDSCSCATAAGSCAFVPCCCGRVCPTPLLSVVRADGWGAGWIWSSRSGSDSSWREKRGCHKPVCSQQWLLVAAVSTLCCMAGSGTKYPSHNSLHELCLSVLRRLQGQHRCTLV